MDDSSSNLDSSMISNSDVSLTREEMDCSTNSPLEGTTTSSSKTAVSHHLFDDDDSASGMGDDENQEPNSPNGSGKHTKNVDDIVALTNSTSYTLGRTDSFREDMQPINIFRGAKASIKDAAGALQLQPVPCGTRGRPESFSMIQGNMNVNHIAAALGPVDFPNMNPPTLSRSDSYREEMTAGMNLPIPAPKLGRDRSESSQNAGQKDSAKKLKPSNDHHDHDINHGNNAVDEINAYDHDNEKSRSSSRFQDDFQVIHFIGVGTFGDVHCVKHLVSGGYYAVKRSKRRFASAGDRDKMLVEVQTMAELAQNEHIVQYYSCWTEDHHVYCQMELCEASVEELMDNYKNKFELKEIYKMLRHVLLGLKFAHNKGIVHLDIKPGNILHKQGNYKISDFGLALHTINGKAKVAGSVEEGDSRFLAREMLDWAPVEDLTKCDIYSVGLSAYELTSNKSVPSHGEEWQMLRSNRWTMPVGVEGEICDIMSACMHSDPKARPAAEGCLDEYVSLMSEEQKQNQFNILRIQALEKELEAKKGPPKSTLKRHHSVV